MTGYSAYIDQISGTLEIAVGTDTAAAPFVDPEYNNFLPEAIAIGELMCYRDLDLLLTRQNGAGNATPNSRSFTLPVPSSGGIYVVLERISFVYMSVTLPPLNPVSRDFLEMSWPDDVALSSPSFPRMWCPVDQKSILVAPPPDQSYAAKLSGTTRPTPLSSTNTDTVLTQYFQDLFFMATMIGWAGFQRDYGAQSDDPQKSASWMGVYKETLASAGVEENRKKLRSESNTLLIPAPRAPQPPAMPGQG